MTAIFADGIFRCIFLNKMIELRLKFHWNFSKGSNWQQASVCSCNGLAPDRRQAITWTNDDTVYWRIFPVQGGMS